MSHTVLEFPTVDRNHRPVLPTQQRARRHLEQLRQTRLKDCPYKDPVVVPLQVIEDASIRLGPLPHSPDAVTWDQITQVVAGLGY